MNVSQCRPYHAKDAGHTTIQMPDGRSAFKLYYVSIIGRDEPERYEWGRCALSQEVFETIFVRQKLAGIGFVTAFPHVTKVFRYSPKAETVLDVRAFHTQTMKPLDLARDDNYVEFACYAEAVIAADEYHAWAKAGTVDEYLDHRCADVDFPVRSHSKLGAYWGGT